MTTYDSEYKAAYITSFLLPIAGLIISIRNFRSPYAKNLFFIFCVFFGFVFIYNPSGGSTADSIRYTESFRQMHKSNESLKDIWKTAYKNTDKGESTSLDIYQPLLSFLISRITGNPHILFLCFAIVFGYFYSRNLWYIFEKVNHNVTISMAIFMLGFALVCPIWEINGVRMWTALQVFVFGALPYLISGNKKSLIWCMFSVLFHFSFIIPVMIIVIYLFLPKDNITLYFVFFIITSFVKELNLSVLNNLVSTYAPDLLFNKVDSYINEASAETISIRESLTSMYVIIAGIASQIVIYTMVISLYFKGKIQIARKPYMLRIYSFALFIFAISQILALIPSGVRFIILSKMFMFPIFILFLDRFRYISSISAISSLTSIILLFSILFTLRIGMEYYGYTIFCNPIVSVFIETTTPLIQFLKSNI